ncbi:uncharacterized protein B0T15DRAFT_529565, partial [Chaetomium strumarium]
MDIMTDEHGKHAPVQTANAIDFVRVDVVQYKNPSHLGYRYSIHLICTTTNYHWVNSSRTKDKRPGRCKTGWN